MTNFQSYNLFKTHLLIKVFHQNHIKNKQTDMYRVASASQCLVITGAGIDDIKLAKKSWVFPGQSCTVFDLSPVNYTFEVQAMSAEKLPFVLPAVFTIGPRVNDEESLMLYAKLLSSHEKLSNHVTELICSGTD